MPLLSFPSCIYLIAWFMVAFLLPVVSLGKSVGLAVTVFSPLFMASMHRLAMNLPFKPCLFEWKGFDMLIFISFIQFFFFFSYCGHFFFLGGHGCWTSSPRCGTHSEPCRCSTPVGHMTNLPQQTELHSLLSTLSPILHSNPNLNLNYATTTTHTSTGTGTSTNGPLAIVNWDLPSSLGFSPSTRVVQSTSGGSRNTWEYY